MSGYAPGQPYWMQIGDEVLRRYDPAKSRVNWELLVGTTPMHFVYNAIPCDRFEEDFHGVADFCSNAVLNILTGEQTWRATTPSGAGTFDMLDIIGGGVRITSGATALNNNMLENGDDGAARNPWHVDYDPYVHFRFRLPLAADLASLLMYIGMFYDANNYVTVRAATAVDANYHLVVNRAGVQTVNVTLEALDNEWHGFYAFLDEAAGYYVWDGGAQTLFGGLLPETQLRAYMMIQTLEDVAKHLDVSKWLILQDEFTAAVTS